MRKPWKGFRGVEAGRKGLRAGTGRRWTVKALIRFTLEAAVDDGRGEKVMGIQVSLVIIPVFLTSFITERGESVQ